MRQFRWIPNPSRSLTLILLVTNSPFDPIIACLKTSISATVNPTKKPILPANRPDHRIFSTREESPNLARLRRCIEDCMAERRAVLNGYSLPPPGGGSRGEVASIFSSYVSVDEDEEEEAWWVCLNGWTDNAGGLAGRSMPV